jgi:hypothetical protein
MAIICENEVMIGVGTYGAGCFIGVEHTVFLFASSQMTASVNHHGTDADWCGFV